MPVTCNLSMSLSQCQQYKAKAIPWPLSPPRPGSPSDPSTDLSSFVPHGHLKGRWERSSAPQVMASQWHTACEGFPELVWFPRPVLQSWTAHHSISYNPWVAAHSFLIGPSFQKLGSITLYLDAEEGGLCPLERVNRRRLTKSEAQTPTLTKQKRGDFVIKWWEFSEW